MKKLGHISTYILGTFLVVPIMMTILFQNKSFLLEKKQDKIERYLPYILYEAIDNDMHFETLKAQAVILRTNLYKDLKEGVLDYGKLAEKCTFSRKEKDLEKIFMRFIRVCEETSGEILLYKEKICYYPYFYCSTGVTRDAFIYFQDMKYPYVISVPSNYDKECKDYTTYHYFSKEEFLEMLDILSGGTYKNNLEILEKDIGGYIMWLKIGEKIISGEYFRKCFNLSSSCFSVEEVESGVRIICKGRGHGFGFSQYGANVMAKDKKDYRELLEYYFNEITFGNVNTFS